MDRAAIFVDAGYVYAQGGLISLGTRSRALMEVDVAGLVKHLESYAQSAIGIPLLRTYWYDGAPQRVATAEHHAIAALPDVKLRLGTINSAGQQKGVDALLYRDLITLAREKSISDAVLVAGDADLCEGVRAAQELGVRVVVVGLTGRGSQKQSLELVQEADRSHLLADSDIRRFFTKRAFVPIAEPRRRREEPPTELPDTAVAAAPKRTDVAAVQSAARAHVKKWLAAASPDDVAALLAVDPRIPTPLDSALLRASEAAIGRSLRQDQALRHAARMVFWTEVREHGQKLAQAP
ncbi:MAG: NYN domain-containing protein [Deltaproteobacteria bacterium]|nr:NYN domain-containing protein [Deltaproteobacteria bacterium]